MTRFTDFFSPSLRAFQQTLPATLTFLVLVFAAPTSIAASFDCRAASRPIEKTICSDPELSSLDEKLNQSYQGALVKNPEIKFSQREWLKALNECNLDSSPIECLRKAFKARIRALNLVAAPSIGTLGIEILGMYRINNQNGLQVGAVTQNGSGYNAGILPGDFIVEVNNSKIDDIDQVMNQLSIPPGQTVLLKIVKKDNSERVIQVRMGSKADTTTQPVLEAGNSTAPGAAADQTQSNAPIIETPLSESKDEKQKPEPDADSDNGSSSKWVIAILLLLGGTYYWKKQKTIKSDTKIQSKPSYSADAPPSARKPQAETREQKKTKDAPSKEELLKQQQMNAFKKLK